MKNIITNIIIFCVLCIVGYFVYFSLQPPETMNSSDKNVTSDLTLQIEELESQVAELQEQLAQTGTGGESNEELTDLTGTTWVFNKPINFVYNSYKVNFVANISNYEVETLNFFEFGTGTQKISYESIDYYMMSLPDLDSSEYILFGSTSDSFSKLFLNKMNTENFISVASIKFLSGEDIKNTNFIAWLQENATLVEVEEVEITDLTGTTWELNDDLNLSYQESLNPMTSQFNINFNSDESTFDKLNFGYFLNNLNNPFGAYYLGSSQTNVYSKDGWSNENYKTIKITGGTDATNADLIAWLQENATQVISFTIKGTTYYAEPGMTWEEWCESDYSITDDGSFIVYDYGYIYSTFYKVVIEDVKSSDLIEPDRKYIINLNSTGGAA